MFRRLTESAGVSVMAQGSRTHSRVAVAESTAPLSSVLMTANTATRRHLEAELAPSSQITSLPHRRDQSCQPMRRRIARFSEAAAPQIAPAHGKVHWPTSLLPVNSARRRSPEPDIAQVIEPSYRRQLRLLHRFSRRMRIIGRQNRRVSTPGAYRLHIRVFRARSTAVA